MMSNITEFYIEKTIYRFNGTSNIETIFSSTFPNFTSSSSVCPIVKYAMYDHNYTIYTGSVVSLNTTNDILINTTLSLSQTTFLFGATSAGNITKYFPLKLWIIDCTEHLILVQPPIDLIKLSLSYVNNPPVKVNLMKHFNSTLSEWCPIT